MPRFFVPATQVATGHAEVLGDDAEHLARSLRIRPGELVRLVDDAGTEHEVRVEQSTAARVAGSVLWSRPASGEPRLRIEVLQALHQGGVEEAVEAMAQVGVCAVRPVRTERAVVRPGADRAEARRRRWQTVAREAAALSLRGAVPTVHPVATLTAALADLPAGARLLVLAVGAQRPLTAVAADPARPLALVVGPEGGLSAAELTLLEDAGAQPVHLGPRVLRSRLAGAVAAALLLARAGDLAAGPS